MSGISIQAGFFECTRDGFLQSVFLCNLQQRGNWQAVEYVRLCPAWFLHPRNVVQRYVRRLAWNDAVGDIRTGERV